MVKPDVICTNPYSIEVPYWRYVMERSRHRFGEIFSVHYQDYRKYNFFSFMKTNMPWAKVIDGGVVPSGRDWRDYCVNMALDESKSDWVLFIEQDFIAEDSFYEDIFEKAEDFDVVGFTELEKSTSLQGDTGYWQHGVRLHPAFILVKRKLVDKTSKDFSAYPKKDRDHFGVFTDELLKVLSIKFLDITDMPNWKHYAGVYWNYMLIQAGEKVYFKPDSFKEYVRLAMESPVVQDSRFLEWSNECLR